MRNLSVFSICFIIIFAPIFNPAQAESSKLWATVILRDGSTLNLSGVSINAPITTGNNINNFNVGGASVPIPLKDIHSFELDNLDWRKSPEAFSLIGTLHDKRTFRTFPRSGHFFIRGTNEFGVVTTFNIHPSNDPATYPFVAIFLGTEDAPPELAHASIKLESNLPQIVQGQHDVIRLRNGDVLTGSVITDVFHIRTSYSTLQIRSAEIASISIEGATGQTDRLILKVSDQLSGVIENSSLVFRLLSGTEINLERGQIENITFRNKINSG